MFPVAFGPLAAFFVPVALVVLARHLALRGSGERVARWFAFARRTQLVIGLAPVAWLLTAMRAVRAMSPHFWFGVQDDPVLVVVVFVVLLTPITLLPALLGLLVQDVAVRLETTRFTRRESWIRAGWLASAFAIGAVPLGLGAFAMANGRAAPSLAAFALGIVAILFGLTRARRGLRLTPHAVTHGPLRDRLFAMAAKAGVPLRQLYVLPVRRLGLANAFAVHGQVVMVTDLLLERLTKTEVDAVLAHEIAHLRRGDPLKLLISRLVLIGGPAMALASSGLLATCAGVLLGVIAASAISRRIEYAADRESLKLGGDAASLISGLSRLARLGHVPLQWSRASEWFLTHPSVERRARALARAANLDEGTWRARLAGEGAPADHYEIGVSADDGARAFTTPFKQRALTGNALVLLSFASLVPAAIFAELRLLGVALPSATSLALAAVAGPLVAIAVLDLMAVQPLHRLRPRIALRLGLGRKPARDGWIFCGLSPHAEPRVYEGFSNWDVGFVRVHDGALEFAGDATSFRLPATRLDDAGVVAGPPSWIRTRSVRVHWRDAAGERHVLRLTPLEGVGLHAIAPLARRLAARIEGLRCDTATTSRPDATEGTVAALPPTAEVTSQSPRSVAPPSSLIGFLVADLLFGSVIGALLGLPPFRGHGPGLVEVVGIAFLTQVVLLLPVWTWRESGAEPDRDAGMKRAA